MLKCKNTRIAFIFSILLCGFGLGSVYGVGTPTGHSDIGLTLKNTAVEVPVLLNDVAASAGVLQVAGIASQAQNGGVTHTLDGIVYTPNTDFVGIDSFTYTLVESLEGELSSGVPVLVEIAVNTPLDMEATRDALLNGVSSIESGNSPTQMFSYGPSSLVVARYGPELDSGAMVVASTLGNGRVVTVPYGMTDIQWYKNYGDSEAFFENVLEWLQGGVIDKSVRIKTRIAQVREWLEENGYTNVTQVQGDFTASAVENTDIIMGHIGTGLSADAVQAVVDAVADGMCLYVPEFGQGYSLWWNKELRDAPINKVLKYSGVVYDDNLPKNNATYVIGRPAVGTGRVTLEEQLAIMDDWSTATEADKVHTVETLPVILRAMLPNSLIYNRIALRAEAGYLALMPDISNPITEGIEQMLLELESGILQVQAVDEIEKHRMADAWYGAVPNDGDRSRKVVDLGLDRARWRPLGMYAPPGEVVTLEFPPELVGQGFEVLVNPHADNITVKEEWFRLPKVQRRFEITNTTMQVGSSVGGSLFVDFGDTIPGTGAADEYVEVGVMGAVEQAHFILGKHQNSDWVNAMRDRPAPYGIIETPNFILHDRMVSQYANGKLLNDAEGLAGFWDQVVVLEDWLNNKFEGERTYAELANRDIQIAYGYAHAGYPYQLAFNWDIDLFDYNTLITGGSWGDYHEIGHNHQDTWWTLSTDGEVTVNVFSNYIYEVLNPDSGHWCLDPGTVWSLALGQVAQGKLYSTMGDIERVYFYIVLADQFGWQAFKDFYQSYRDDKKNNPSALPADNNDAEELAQILTRFSNIVGRDISPFMESYGLYPSAEAKAAVSTLEGWNPFDLFLVLLEPNLEFGESTEAWIYVPEGTTNVGLTVDGTAVTLNAESATSYSYALDTPALGVTTLVATIDNNVSETRVLTVTGVNLDQDGDGMADAWEAEHNLNLRWNDSAKDWDGDGFTSLEEFIAGSDPTDSGAFFKTEIESQAQDSLELSCPSVAGRSYQLYRSIDLMNWSAHGDAQTSNPPKNTFTVPIDPVSNGKYFYRIEVSQ